MSGQSGGRSDDAGGFSPAATELDSGAAQAEDTSVAEAEDTSVAAAEDANVAPVEDTNVAPAEDSAVADSGSVSTDSGSVVVVDASPAPVWRKANLTWYTSYPDPGSEECIKYNGCEWAGQFAALPSKMPESWVKANNIASIHSKDFATYKLKTLRLRQGTKQIDVKVYDMCADSDCSGCCTKNASSTGFLIDIEKYTAQRFGTNSGVVEWTCLDC